MKVHLIIDAVLDSTLWLFPFSAGAPWEFEWPCREDKQKRRVKRSWAIEGGGSAWAECWCWDVRRRSTAGAFTVAESLGLVWCAPGEIRGSDIQVDWETKTSGQIWARGRKERLISQSLVGKEGGRRWVEQRSERWLQVTCLGSWVRNCDAICQEKYNRTVVWRPGVNMGGYWFCFMNAEFQNPTGAPRGVTRAAASAGRTCVCLALVPRQRRVGQSESWRPGRPCAPPEEIGGWEDKENSWCVQRSLWACLRPSRREPSEPSRPVISFYRWGNRTRWLVRSSWPASGPGIGSGRQGWHLN